jgi:hypothetical protein
MTQLLPAHSLRPEAQAVHFQQSVIWVTAFGRLLGDNEPIVRARRPQTPAAANIGASKHGGKS